MTIDQIQYINSMMLKDLGSRPEMNGREGRVLEAPDSKVVLTGDAVQDAGVGRYKVLVAGNDEDTGEVLAVKNEKMWA